MRAGAFMLAAAAAGAVLISASQASAAASLTTTAAKALSSHAQPVVCHGVQCRHDSDRQRRNFWPRHRGHDGGRWDNSRGGGRWDDSRRSGRWDDSRGGGRWDDSRRGGRWDDSRGWRNDSRDGGGFNQPRKNPNRMDFYFSPDGWVSNPGSSQER
jgi:hypothetical protein